MTTEDKLYNKIKKASENAAEKDFPGFEKVWNRVDEKLDTVTVKKSSKLWKVGTIAASFLLMASLGYHFYNQSEHDFIPKNEKQLEKTMETNSNEMVLEESSPLLEKKEMDKIIEANTNVPVLVSADEISEERLFPEAIEMIKDDVVVTYRKDSVKPLTKEKSILGNAEMINPAVSSSNSTSSNQMPLAKATKSYDSDVKKLETKKITNDLILIDDKLSDTDKLSKISAEEIDSAYYMANPLYIINGVEYSEESLFGKQPTSPYAPLAKQKITTYNILKPEEAIKKYGKKGENGVIIIKVEK